MDYSIVQAKHLTGSLPNSRHATPASSHIFAKICKIVQDGTAGADPNRVGGPTNHLLSNDLTTDITQGRGTATLAQTLKRTAGQGGGDPDKALSQAFRRVKALCQDLGLSQMIIDTACEIYKKSWQAGVVKGRAIASVVPAVVFIACRKENLPSEEPRSLNCSYPKIFADRYNLCTPHINEKRFLQQGGVYCQTWLYVCTHLNSHGRHVKQ